MAFTRIPLNIKRFYFMGDEKSGLLRKRVKNYFDKNGNKIYEKELYKFNDLYINEPREDGEPLEFVYRNIVYDEKGHVTKTPEIIDSEEFNDFKSLSYTYNIAEGKIYSGTIYVDSKGKYLGGYGDYLGVIKETKKRISNVAPTILGFKDKDMTYSIWQTKNGKTKRIRRTLKTLYTETIVCYVDNDGKECCVVTEAEDIRKITRIMSKDKITINYCDNKDNILGTEEFFIDDNVKSSTKIENNDSGLIGHNITYLHTTKDGEYREIWLTDNGENEKTNEPPDVPIPEPIIKGGE